MDIRMYFQKLREAEQGIEGDFVVVVSKETPDGGKAGRLSEVARGVAARLIVSGRARLASAEERAAFEEEREAARTEAEQARLAGRVQLAVLSETELRALRSSLRPQKG